MNDIASHGGVVFFVCAIVAVLVATFAVRRRTRLERQNAGVALRRSEELYRGLVEACPDAIFHLTLEGNVITANQQLATLFGYQTVPLGSNAIDFIAPAERNLARQRLKALLADGVHRGHEYTCIRVDASHFPVEISTALMRDDKGYPHSLVGLIRDVSRRKQAEYSAAQARIFLERVVNALPTPIFVKGRDHRFIMVNDALCALLGLPREAMLGNSDRDLLPAAQADLFERMDDIVFATRQQNVNDEEITDGTGARRSIVTHKNVFEDAAGRDVLVGVINDVTERKRMEEMLRLSAQVFEHATEGMFVSDENNKILMVNRAFTEITGYSADETVGRNPSMLGSNKQPQAFYERMWHTVLADGAWQGELINRRKNGELYPEWLNISVVRDDAGRIVRHMALFSDITQRKRAEEKIRFLAQHDELTSLPNRTLLRDRVEQALERSRRSNGNTALLMLDLDGFKAINDTFGHQTGDELLKEVAQRLTTCVRKSDTVCRLGGDEFVVLVAETAASVDAQVVARKVLAELGRPFLLAGQAAHIGVSIGVSVFPENGADADSLLRAADEAMYRVKQTGRNSVAFAVRPGPVA